jgi:signal transduction histidine kinase
MQKVKQFVLSPTGRLSASYLAIIMAMSLAFSFVLFQVSANELDRQLPPESFYTLEKLKELNPNARITHFFEQRITEGHRTLVNNFVLLNTFTLLVGSLLSYYLARRTLKPIEDSMAAQIQFVSDASHELRTPLSVLQTTNEVALRRKSLTIEQAKELIDQNVKEVSQLQQLTGNLLKLAAQETPSPELAPIRIKRAADEAVHTVLPLAQQKSMHLQDDLPDGTVLAHEAALVQVMTILLDNAIKYSPPGSHLTLRAIQRAKYWYIEVIDEGPGIKAEDQARIFDRFYRVDQSRSKQRVEGHGIGLSLAQKLMQQQGGSLKVTSKFGKGATFTIVLPAV